MKRLPGKFIVNRKTALAACAALAAAAILTGPYAVYDETMAPAITPGPEEETAAEIIDTGDDPHGLRRLLAETSDEDALDAFLLALDTPLQEGGYGSLAGIIYAIKEQEPAFGIISSGEIAGAEYDGTSIRLGRGVIDNGRSGSVLHELGHAIFSHKYDYYMPTAYLALAGEVRSRVTEEKLPEVEEFFANLNTYYDILHSESFASGFDHSLEGYRIRKDLEDLYDSDRDAIAEILAEKYVESLIPDYIDDRERAVGRAYEIERDKTLRSRTDIMLRNFVDTSGYRATGGIISALFGTREIPINDEGGTFLLCSPGISFGHDGEVFAQHTNRPFMEQLLYYFELKMSGNDKHLGFLADTLGPGWTAMMEEELRNLLADE